MADARTIEMIADACLGVRSDDELREDLSAYLAQHGVDADDIAAIVEAPRRLGVYRRLVRNNLTDVTFKMMPRTRARMNAVTGGAFDATLDMFLATVAPRTHYLRDVPHELFAWAEPLWRARADIPAYLVDLARHELAEYAVAAAPSRDVPPLVEVSLGAPVVLSAAMTLVTYAYPVHELSADVDDRTAPTARPTSLLVYRDAAHAVRFLECTPLAASITSALVTGATLQDALVGACAEHDAPVDDGVLAAVSRLLADLGDRGVLLGAPAPTDSTANA